MFTRVRALLAGALVLGVGATLTLAAWTDDEQATGTFATSTFNIEGSTDGSSFSQHLSGSPAGLTFSIPTGGMSPNTTVYGLFSVRTTEATNVPGSVLLTSEASGNATYLSYLTYGVRTISGANCNASTFSSGITVVGSGSNLAVDGSSSQGLSNTLDAPGTQVNYCFEVKLAGNTPNSMQGEAANATWTFTATSDS